MSKAMTRAQIEILARLLGTEPHALASMEHLTAGEVERLRSSISDVLFDQLSGTFSKVSKAAPLIPDALVAPIAMKVIPPEVAGRAAGAVAAQHPHRAKGILKSMAPAYLADAAPYVDPRAIPLVAPHVSGELLGPAAREMLRRRDYVTAARFVEFADERLARELHSSLDDDEGIVLTAALVMSTERIDDILGVIPHERIARIGRMIADADQDVVVAGFAVLDRIDEKSSRPMIAALVGELDVAGVARIATLAVEHDFRGEFVRVLTKLDQPERGRVGDALAAGALIESFVDLPGAGELFEPVAS